MKQHSTTTLLLTFLVLMDVRWFDLPLSRACHHPFQTQENGEMLSFVWENNEQDKARATASK